MWSSPPETLSLLWPSLFVPVAYVGLISAFWSHLCCTELPVCKYRGIVFLGFLSHFGRGHLLVAFRRMMQKSKFFLKNVHVQRHLCSTLILVGWLV